jgi:ectoine hydroxylase-related dioxygenase (phytanoyl-CoA dioxygenase family)
MALQQQLTEQGFAIAPNRLDSGQIATLRQLLTQPPDHKPVPGIRGLLDKYPPLRQWVNSPAIRELVEPILGPDATIIRSVFFNKSPAANWQVAWHQDLAIAVKAQHEAAGFSGWSCKETIPHVQPPVAILQTLLTVRIHLDAADDSNGALWVVPGSHTLGRLPAQQAASVAKARGKQLCAVQAGDVMLFRPLLLHASKKAVSDCQRRVIHLEFSATPLPEPLVWAEWGI